VSGSADVLLGALKDFKRAVRTSSDIALGSVASPTWADVDTGLDLVLTASAGDMIEYGVSGLLATPSVDAYFDVATVVSNAPVNYFSSGSGSPAVGGVSAWLVPGGSLHPLTGACLSPPLIAGDISNGTVTLRMRYSKAATTARTLYATAPDPLVVWAKNLGRPGALGVQSAPVWQDWTPTWSNLTVGNGTQSARYTQSGKTVSFVLSLVLGSTSSVGSAVVTFSLPVVAAGSPSFAAVYNDNGSNPHSGSTFPNSTSVAGLVHDAANWVSTNSPMTWTNGDSLYVSGTYEAA